MSKILSESKGDFRKRDLSPYNLSEFVGQTKTVNQLKVMIQASKNRGEPLDHILIHGPPGLGKTTLVYILSHYLNCKIVKTSGTTIEKGGDIVGILTNMEDNDILFIDEIHRLSKNIEEYLYPAMESRTLEIIVDKGPNARSLEIPLKKFTLIGATTKLYMITPPLRSRFPFTFRLDYYTLPELQKIVLQSAQSIGLFCDKLSALEIASRSRGTPRTANNLLKWIRDYVEVHNKNKITVDMVKRAFEMISIDDVGLNNLDKKVLQKMVNYYNGGPVGIKSIAASVGEEEETISDVHEPYLIMKGLIKRTPRGREVTKLGYQYLGIE